MLKAFKDIFASVTGANRFTKTDAVLMKTALMLAAVDGEVSDEEVAHFKAYAEQCRGYNDKSFGALWEKALRSAGYLFLQSKFLSQEDLIAAFVKESEVDFVDELVSETTEERKHAFEFLERMAQSDGEFSVIEREAIAALIKTVRKAREKALADRFSRSSIYGK